jgi:hypothetical protein
MTQTAQQILPQTLPRPERGRAWLRRWLMRVLVAVTTLLVVAVVVAEIVLHSTIPKQIVIAQVQRTLGLRVTAAEVSTGWLGHTTLRNVTVSLPLAEHAFLEMPELHVTHTILPILVITQSIDISAITLDRPLVHVTEDREGRWNLQDVAQLLGRIGGNGQSPQSQQSSPLVLPAVTLTDGQIDITDNNGRTAKIAPLNVIGKPVNALVWEYDASCDNNAGTHIKLTGRVAPNDNFSHEVDFALSGLAAVARPWLASFDPAAYLKGHWHGAKTADGVAGRLQLETFKYSSVTASQGDISIALQGSALTVTPRRLIVDAGVGSLGSLSVAGGSVSLDSTAAKANAVEISGLNGRALASGSFTFADQSGNLHAEWNTLQPTPTVTSSGMLDATLRSNWPDQRALKVSVVANGMAANKNYDAIVNMTGDGKSWDNARLTVTAPVLRWSGGQSVALDHLTAHLTTTPGLITLADVSLPGSTTVAGGGALRFDPHKPTTSHFDWWLYLQGQNWTNPYAPGAALGFGLNIWGNQTQIRLQQAFGIVGRIYSCLDGYYRFEEPKPVDLNLSICELPTPPGDAPDVIRGKVRGEGRLTGTLYPLALDAWGYLHGQQIVIEDRPPQNINVRCTADLHDGRFSFDTEQLALLGGEWSVHGQIPAQKADWGNAPDITLLVHDLPLANLADLVHEPNISGVAGGSLEVDVGELAINQISAFGHFEADHVQARQFKADSATAEVSLQDGLVEISSIQLHCGSGNATAKLSAQMSHPQLITATLDATDWPIDVGPVHALASASTTNLAIDVSTQTAIGQLQFNTAARIKQGQKDRPLLSADGTVGLAGRVINLQKLEAKILNGDASGSATVDIDHPLASRGNFRFDELDLSKLAGYDPLYQTANGFLTGRADLAPTTDPRALAPLMLDVATVGQSTRFRSVGFTEAHLPIYFSKDRVVTSGGKINVAGGTIGLYARASLHPMADNTLSAQIQANLDSLDLQQLIHAADKNEADKLKQYPGKVSGTISLVGDPRDKLQLFGEASLQIHQSDLGEFGPFAVLYNTMHLGGNAGTPIGEGTVEARYDNDSVIVSSLRYFNRGVDAYGLAEVDRVSQYPNCPLSGELVGTFSPLRNINLPFFADADKIFSVLQTNLTSIVIGGTFAKPSYLPESAAAIGSAMRTFLLGDVTSQSK